MAVRPLLIADLDDSLIHQRPIASAEAVPGSWMAQSTLQALGRMANTFDIVLATLRS